jgi:hypothetical protein
MAYTAEKPRLTPTVEQLRSTIPGWGVDLDPKDRPAVPKERLVTGQTGAHWTFPERQLERFAREKTPEHKFLTPVFGTACPPRGLSGMIRRYAYTFSEARLAHWLLLLGADRVDVLEHRVEGLLTGAPDDAVAESGVMSELERNGMRARRGRGRADVKRQPLDLLFSTAGALLSPPRLRKRPLRRASAGARSRARGDGEPRWQASRAPDTRTEPEERRPQQR